MSLLRLHVQLGIDQRMWRVQPSFLLSSDLPNTARQLRRPRGGAYRSQPRILIYLRAVSLASLQQATILSLALISHQRYTSSLALTPQHDHDLTELRGQGPLEL